MEQAKKCKEKIVMQSDDGYEATTLKCCDIIEHKIPHKTKMEKNKYIYWSEGIC